MERDAFDRVRPRAVLLVAHDDCVPIGSQCLTIDHLSRSKVIRRSHPNGNLSFIAHFSH